MLCEPVAMASVLPTPTFSQTSPCCYHQYGARLPYFSSCHKPYPKLFDSASFSHSTSSSSTLVLTAKAQVATISDPLATPQASTISETLSAPATTLPKRFSHLADLVTQLSDGADVPSALEPWQDKLSIYDWNALLLEFKGKDWNISWQILAFFREKSPVLDQYLLCEKKDEEEALESSAQIAQEAPETETPQEAQKSTEVKAEETMASTAEEAQETLASSTEEAQDTLGLGSEEFDETLESGAEKAQETLEPSSEKASPSLKLHTTLVRVLARNKRFEELDQLQVLMKEAGIEADGAFYNALADSYADEGLAAKASEVLQEMKTAGVEPHRFIYEKIAHIHMNQENPDLDLPTEIMKDLMRSGLPVNVGIFKTLLKAHWEAKDVAGAEEAFEAMQAAGHTPDLKVLSKVMQLHGRRGNHERILQLMQKMTKWGIQPNASVYDYLVHAYCKAGLMEKAKETFLKYRSVLGIKPTIIAFNMLVDGYGKQGLYQEALQVFEEIRKNGYRRSTVSYSSIISAMAQVEKFDKAAQLYKQMLKEGVQPNLHTYMTIIRCYTKCNWTREGHKIYSAMRKAPVQMTEAAYGTALALYVQGNWYHHAAALLKEIEKEGVALDAAAHGALIQSFSILENKLTPLARAVQESDLEVCRLLTSLFLTNLENQTLNPKLVEAVFSFLDKWKETDSLEAKAFVYNAFLECFWKKGFKHIAKRILGLAREVYAGYSRPRLHETEWVLDVRGLSVGGAKVALIDWLTSVGDGTDKSVEDDLRMVVITGDEFLLHVPQDNRVLKGAVSLMLGELGSPFVESPEDSKKLEASAVDVLKWVSQDEIRKATSLDNSQFYERRGQCPQKIADIAT